MTDSSLDTNSGDGAFDAGASVDELFGEFAEESLEGETVDPSAETTAADDADEGVEDQTAADVFSQLRAAAENDADEVLADESPEDIIASADEPDAEPELDDDLRVDDDALADLLLTGRTKGEEFLWVESGSDEDVDDDDAAVEAGATVDPAVDTDDTDEALEVDTGGLEDADGESDDLEPITDEPESAAASENESDATDDSESDVDAGATDEETEETALAPADEETLPAPTEDEESSGFFGWLRSKLGGLF